VTSFEQADAYAFKIQGFASLVDMATDFDAATPLGEFTASPDNYGKEWITGPIPARFVLLAQE